MSFIGIITNSKNEDYIKRMLSQYIPDPNIIFITDRNINNIKNVKFKTIVINDNLKDIKNLKIILSKTENVILNSDIIKDFEILENLNLSIISYGFNSKATFTMSSISDNSGIFCLQRMITNVYEKKYEPQEFEFEFDKNVDIYAALCIQIIKIMYEK